MFTLFVLTLVVADIGDVVAISGAAALRTSGEIVSPLVSTVDSNDDPWLARVLEERSGLLYVERIVNDATLCDDAVGHVRLRAWVSANAREPLLAAPLVHVYDDGTRLELPAGRVVRDQRVRVMGSYEVPLPRTATTRLQLRESEFGQLAAQDGEVQCLADADVTAATLDDVPLHRLEGAASRRLGELGLRLVCGHASTPERLRIADGCGALTVATTTPHERQRGGLVGGSLGSGPPDAQVAVYFATGGAAGSAELPESSLRQGPRGCGALDDYVLCREDGASVDVDALWLPLAAPETPPRQRTFDTASLPEEAHGLVVLAGIDHRGQVWGARVMTKGAAVPAPVEAAVVAAVRSSTWTPAFHRGKAVDAMHRIVLDLHEPRPDPQRLERALSDPPPTQASPPSPLRTGPCGLPALPPVSSSMLRSRATATQSGPQEASTAPTRAPQVGSGATTPSPASSVPATSQQGGCTFDSDCRGRGTCVRAMGHVGECREVVRSNGMPALDVNPQPSTCTMDSDCGSFGRCERVGGGYFCVR